ncbi:MAG TPA: cobyrinate a,c-diamide synthase [Candidatus Binataceae bacterium]|nr:cobyrinate a,c-diamide synthase [Candidatus Binataceae bacterium]
MDPAPKIPRIVIGATGSGVGKTTVTVAILGALRARGLNLAAFKCGPDYLDPTYHARALGRPSQNLDGWMMGREGVLATFARAAAGADIAVIEGVMGLFDGATPVSDEGSTAEIAKWLEAPVIVVCDAYGIARTVSAIAAGFARFDPSLNVAGLICNRVGSRGHLDLLHAAKPELTIGGGFPRSDELAFPERHLGLRTADRDSIPDEKFVAWSRLAEEWLDLDAIISLARSAPALANSIESEAREEPRARCRIGVAYDDAFHFYYADNLRRLESLGAELIFFSPVREQTLPAVDGLYFGGGYPEVLAQELAANHAMLDAVCAFAARGGPIYAECGGLMYLADGIKTLDGKTHPMVGLVPGVTVMRDRLQALGYVEVETRAASIVGPAGTKFRGHQFRYSTLERNGDARGIEEIYRVAPRWGGVSFTEGYRSNNVLASYVHAHWASNPNVAEGLVASCVRARAR